MSESTRAQLVDAIRRMRADGASYRAIGRELSVSQQFAWRMLNGPGRRRGGTRRDRFARALYWPLRSPWTRREWAIGVAVAIAVGTTLGLLIRRVRAARARDAELRARILAAAANDAARAPAPAPLETPSPSAPASDDDAPLAAAETASTPAPHDPAHVDERPPELAGPLDAFGRAIPPKGAPPPPPIRPYPPRRLN